MMDINAQPTSIRSAVRVRWSELAKLSIKVKFLTPECTYWASSLRYAPNEALPTKLGEKSLCWGGRFSPTFPRGKISCVGKMF